MELVRTAVFHSTSRLMELNTPMELVHPTVFHSISCPMELVHTAVFHSTSRPVELNKHNRILFHFSPDGISAHNCIPFHFSSTLLNSAVGSGKQRTVSSTVVCPAVCINDITSNAGICGKGIKYVMCQTFFIPFVDKERTSMAAPCVGRIRSEKKDNKYW